MWVTWSGPTCPVGAISNKALRVDVAEPRVPSTADLDYQQTSQNMLAAVCESWERAVADGIVEDPRDDG